MSEVSQTERQISCELICKTDIELQTWKTNRLKGKTGVDKLGDWD